MKMAQNCDTQEHAESRREESPRDIDELIFGSDTTLRCSER